MSDSLRELLAVVIITHNRRQDLARTLDRMLALPESPPLIVIDNASTDGTPAMLRQRYPQVRAIALDRNFGGAARNLGARVAGTRYIALCDDDSWWEPGALPLALQTMERHPQIAALCGRVQLGEQRRVDPVCELMAASPLPREAMPGPVLLGFVACATVFRTAAFLAAGGCREPFFVGGEEELLALDLTALGWRVVYLPEMVVRHFPSPQRDPAGRRRIVRRNALWVAWLRLPWIEALGASWQICRAARREGQLSAVLRDALREWRWIVRERRLLPPPLLAWRRLLSAAEAPAASDASASSAAAWIDPRDRP